VEPRIDRLQRLSAESPEIAARLRARGAAVDADDVIVTNGAQQAIAIAAERLGATTVGVDAETYPSALDLFRSRGLAIVHGGQDRHDRPADWWYAMPGIGNPHGNGMTAGERQALLATGLPVIADEAYAELRFDGKLERPLLADARDRVWHVGTLSKTLCPGLRVGWLIPPSGEREAFVARESFDARLAEARRFYEARAHRLARAFRRHLPSWRFREPEGGFSIYLETDLRGDDTALLEIAARHGVSFDPGRLFRASGESSPIAMRVCYSTASRDEDIDEAARRIARAAKEFARGSRARA
jgi:2-aminoadipate transaminase